MTPEEIAYRYAGDSGYPPESILSDVNELLRETTELLKNEIELLKLSNSGILSQLLDVQQDCVKAVKERDRLEESFSDFLMRASAREAAVLKAMADIMQYGTPIGDESERRIGVAIEGESVLSERLVSAWMRAYDVEENVSQAAASLLAGVVPVPMVLHCPKCSKQHLDEGEYRHVIHKTHLCLFCGHEWRPAKVPTVGVRALE